MTPLKDIIKALTVTGQRLINDDAEAKESYKPFAVNRILSKYQHDLYWADAMNQLSHLDKIMQHDFYLLVLRKYYRPFVKHPPRKTDDDLALEAIMFRYTVSWARAYEILRLMPADEIEITKQMIYKGGQV